MREGCAIALRGKVFAPIALMKGIVNLPAVRPPVRRAAHPARVLAAAGHGLQSARRRPDPASVLAAHAYARIRRVNAPTEPRALDRIA